MKVLVYNERSLKLGYCCIRIIVTIQGVLFILDHTKCSFISIFFFILMHHTFLIKWHFNVLKKSGTPCSRSVKSVNKIYEFDWNGTLERELNMNVSKSKIRHVYNRWVDCELYINGQEVETSQSNGYWLVLSAGIGVCKLEILRRYSVWGSEEDEYGCI